MQIKRLYIIVPKFCAHDGGSKNHLRLFYTLALSLTLPIECLLDTPKTPTLPPAVVPVRSNSGGVYFENLLFRWFNSRRSTLFYHSLLRGYVNDVDSFPSPHCSPVRVARVPLGQAAVANVASLII